MTVGEVKEIQRDLRYVAQVGTPWQIYRAREQYYRWEHYLANKEYYDGLREESKDN